MVDAWETALYTEISTKLTALGGDSYVLFDPKGGSEEGKIANDIKAAWQDNLLAHLQADGHTINKRIWGNHPTPSFSDRQNLITFFSRKLTPKPKVDGVLHGENTVLYYICLRSLIDELEDWEIESEGRVEESDGQINYRIFEKVCNV